MGWGKRKCEENAKNLKINKVENRAAPRYDLFETISGDELVKINSPEDDSDSDMSSQQKQRLENMRKRRPVFHIGPKPKPEREVDSQTDEEDTSEKPPFHERDLYLGSHWIRHKICAWPCSDRIPIPLRYKLMPPYSQRYNSRKHPTLTFRNPTDSVKLAFLLPKQLMNFTKRRLLMHYGSELNYDTKGCRLPMEYDNSPRSANEKNHYFQTLHSIAHSRRALQQIEQLANKEKMAAAAAAIGEQLSPAERERVEQLKAANQSSLRDEQPTEDSAPPANQVKATNAMPTANQVRAVNAIPAANQVRAVNAIPTANQVKTTNAMPTSNQVKATNAMSTANQVTAVNAIPTANQVTAVNAIPTANQITATNATPAAKGQTDRQSKPTAKRAKRNGKKTVKTRRKAGINKDINSRSRSRR